MNVYVNSKNNQRSVTSMISTSNQSSNCNNESNSSRKTIVIRSLVETVAQVKRISPVTKVVLVRVAPVTKVVVVRIASIARIAGDGSSGSTSSK